MKTHKWDDVRKVKLSAKEIAANDRWAMRELLALDLREIRELAGKTQADLAKKVHMTQGEVSRQERRSDQLLSSLRRYVEGLGGELEVVARIEGKTVRLR